MSMSTEFRTTTTDEMAFVRFCRSNESGTARTSFEFGTVTNFERVCAGCDAGETFFGDQGPLDSDPEFTRAGFEAALVDDRVTFGTFPFTVEVGSGDAFRMTEEL